MDAASFRDDENWHGGYYELAVDLGSRVEHDSTDRLSRALAATWADDRLRGCYLDRWTSRASQQPISPFLTDQDHPAPLYGTALLPSGDEVVCVTHIVREPVDADSVPHDWLALCLPVGALARVDHRVGGFPFEEPDTSIAWRRPIDSWLVEIGVLVFREAGFDSAFVDFEASAFGLPNDVEQYSGAFMLSTPTGLRVQQATA